MDTSGHGTSVAGVVGAVGNNGQGTVGVAWHVPLVAVRILDSDDGTADEKRISKAIEYALKRGARVLNASWSAEGAESVLISDAITHAATAGKTGALLIASSGNKRKNIDDTPVYPASYAHENIIAVAATLNEDIEKLSPSSGVGKTSVDLAAPGIGIKTTKLNQGYATRDGTSFAVPHVTGAVALVWGDPRHATKTAQEVRQLLFLNVDKTLASLAGNCATGGRLDLTFLRPSVQQQAPLP
jgi:subtilisin family serine protease